MKFLYSIKNKIINFCRLLISVRHPFYEVTLQTTLEKTTFHVQQDIDTVYFINKNEVGDKGEEAIPLRIQISKGRKIHILANPYKHEKIDLPHPQPAMDD